MSRLLTPAVPMNPDLGTTWKPDVGPQEGPLATDRSRALAEGLIRVLKVCRRCGRDFKGWMFIAHYRRREAKLETPYHVGPYRACDTCVDGDELISQIASLETKIVLARSRWDAAAHLVKKIPAGRELARLLEQLTGLLTFGSGRFKKASDQLDAVRNWLDERNTDGAA